MIIHNCLFYEICRLKNLIFVRPVVQRQHVNFSGKLLFHQLGFFYLVVRWILNKFFFGRFCLFIDEKYNSLQWKTKINKQRLIAEVKKYTFYYLWLFILYYLFRYMNNKDFSWLQLVNVFGLYWGLFFFSAYGELVLAGVFSKVICF